MFPFTALAIMNLRVTTCPHYKPFTLEWYSMEDQPFPPCPPDYRHHCGLVIKQEMEEDETLLCSESFEEMDAELRARDAMCEDNENSIEEEVFEQPSSDVVILRNVGFSWLHV